MIYRVILQLTRLIIIILEGPGVSKNLKYLKYNTKRMVYSDSLSLFICPLFILHFFHDLLFQKKDFLVVL